MTEASTVLPLFDLFLDLPHPRASPECPGAFVIPAPASSSSSSSSSSFLQQITPHQVAQFAFPEIAAAVTDPSSSPANTRLNRYDVYATQTTNAHFTFSWQLADGRRLHGHVRRYLPSHLAARTRFDVGRRGERALVLLTRHAGTADALYAAVLKYVFCTQTWRVCLSHCRGWFMMWILNSEWMGVFLHLLLTRKNFAPRFSTLMTSLYPTEPLMRYRPSKYRSVGRTSCTMGVLNSGFSTNSWPLSKRNSRP